MTAQPKPKTFRSPKYLAWLRTQPCAWCGRPAPSEAAHMGGGGKGIKGPDNLAIPLCGGPNGCHAYSHRHGVLPLGQSHHGTTEGASVTGAGMRAWAATVSSGLFERFERVTGRQPAAATAPPGMHLTRRPPMTTKELVEAVMEQRWPDGLPEPVGALATHALALEAELANVCEAAAPCVGAEYPTDAEERALKAALSRAADVRAGR